MTALTPTLGGQSADLRAELAQELFLLREAEAQLAREQATVNRFRLHCRLKIGDWVERVLELRTEQQRLLTQWQLRDDAEAEGLPFDEGDPLAHLPPEGAEPLLLPTDVPHDKAAEKRLYRQLVKRFHPDLVGAGVERAYATSMMSTINQAHANGDIATLQALAGELDPIALAELQQIAIPELRQLRQRILQCQRRRRKVAQQLISLRAENTSRLCYRAQQLEEAGLSWWEEVRHALEDEGARLTEQIAYLREKWEIFSPKTR